MAIINDQDRAFTGEHKSSTPKNLLTEGQISRLINGRFIKGAISNALAFEELEFTFSQGINKRIFTSTVTYQELLSSGDLQLTAPLVTPSGEYLILIISGFIFLADLSTHLVYDITPRDSFLPLTSTPQNILSYLDNSGGVSGVGGYAVIFNYPNRPIFINDAGARISSEVHKEMPVARLGASAGNRVFIVSGDNILWASDPLGGADPLAPLTFHETLDPSTGFTGQVFTIGSPLDTPYVTALARLPKFLGPSQEFLAQNLLASTLSEKTIIAAGAKRDTWTSIQFLTYAGSLEGISGSLATTNVGDSLIYMSLSGRIKNISQDQIRETGLQEIFFDDDLGQFLNECEVDYHFRDWYKNLNHTRSILKFSQDKLYASVYPMYVPSIDRYGKKYLTLTHRALAVASLASETNIGSQAKITWEGFYDWINPAGMVTIRKNLYVTSKDIYGHIKILKKNSLDPDTHPTIIVTRGYFSNVNAITKSLTNVQLYFKKLSGPINVELSYLSNNKWICAGSSTIETLVYEFSKIKIQEKTSSYSIPIKLKIDHKGTNFELERINVKGEAHAGP